MKFSSTDLAKQAAEQHKFPVIKGKTCRLLPYNKDLLKNIEGLSIFVKNIPKNYTHKDLYDLFKDQGAIRSCKISLNEDHENNGFGYVAFENPETTLKAINNLNGKKVGDAAIEVSAYKKQGSSEPKYNNLYVKEFPVETTDDELTKHFG